jgi:putative lipoprotein
MRRLPALAFLLFLASATPSAAQTDGVEPYRPSRLFLSSAEQGGWLAADKELHFAGSMAVAASLRVEGRTEASAVGITVGLGLAKEIYDVALKPRRMGRGASWKDLAADLAGALAGIALFRALE